MAEPNGSGRLDRIEALFQAMVEPHNEEFKKLMTWQVLMQDKMDKYWDYLQAQERLLQAESEMRKFKDKSLDERVDKLVSAIGELISRLPAKL